ncbi:hypothetical protein [Mesorhizobium sp. M1B.F.Ca.ET.045.04.1.1]|uniref:hypothetical protein n=1 Tax=Mesorhizobium sp. M1B.F.Ca.ET.045.04.1.1 TaxID=2493673 RepID=UPI001FDED138|nr:hypothetical protein [Mesorhizobium sp. M1B.F.Ca.ET.045.04.1.1]
MTEVVPAPERPVEQQRIARDPGGRGAAEREQEAVAMAPVHGRSHQAADNQRAEHDDDGYGIFLEIAAAAHRRPHRIEIGQIVRIKGAGRAVFVLTEGFAHHSFSAGRQQTINARRAQPGIANAALHSPIAWCRRATVSRQGSTAEGVARFHGLIYLEKSLRTMPCRCSLS